MARDWEGDWDRIEAEYRDARDAALALRGLVTVEEVAAYRRATDRLREATDHRLRFIDERQRANPAWPTPTEPPPAPT